MGYLFKRGLKDIRAGIFAKEWTDLSIYARKVEWTVIAYALGGVIAANKIIEQREETNNVGKRYATFKHHGFWMQSTTHPELIKINI